MDFSIGQNIGRDPSLYTGFEQTQVDAGEGQPAAKGLTQVKPVLDGASLTVAQALGGLDALVAQLNAEIGDRREEMKKVSFAAALAVALGQFANLDNAQQEVVEAIGELADEQNEAQREYEEALQKANADPDDQSLADAVAASQRKVESIGAELKAATARLDDIGRTVVSTAMNVYLEMASGVSLERTQAEQDRDERKVMAKMDMFVDLLGGEKLDLRAVIEENRKVWC